MTSNETANPASLFHGGSDSDCSERPMSVTFSLGVIMQPPFPKQVAVFKQRLLALAMTIVLTLAGSGCSHSCSDELAIIKQKVDAKQVQGWAKQILKEHPDRIQLYPYFPDVVADSTMVILSNPPAFLQIMGILGRMGPSISVSPAGDSSNRCVSLFYAYSPGFGGPGHVIEAGDESYRL